MSKVPTFKPLIEIAFDILIKKEYTEKDRETLKYCLENMPKEDINKKGKHRRSCLHYLCMKEGNADLVKIMLNRDSINLHVRDEWGLYPLSRACQIKNNVETVKLLIDHPLIDIDDRDEEGYTALHEACDYNNFKVAKLLLENKADPNAEGSFNRTTPFLVACMTADSQDILKLFLNDERTDIHAVDRSEMGGVELARIFKLEDHVRLLENLSSF